MNVSFVMDDHLYRWQYSRTKEKTTMCHTTLGSIAGLQNWSKPGVNSMVNDLSMSQVRYVYVVVKIVLHLETLLESCYKWDFILVRSSYNYHY